MTSSVVDRKESHEEKVKHRKKSQGKERTREE